MTKSRQLREPITDNDSGLPEGKGYCRKCQKVKSSGNFFSAVNKELDCNNMMSFCKSCVDEIYSNSLIYEKGNIQKATLRTCRILDVKFNPVAIDSALKQIETKGSDPKRFFGFYKAKLLLQERENPSDVLVDLSYQHDTPIIINNPENILKDDEFEEARDLKEFWRVEDKEDLEFLETEFANFKKTNKATTHAEIVLLKEICYKLLDMYKDRKQGKSTDSSLKQLMSIMEKSLISPNMVNAANSGENLDTFGAWIADIEKEEPAQWLENEGRELYKDVDNVEEYFQKYFVRPLRNFILQAKDWNIDDEGLDDDDGDIFSDKADGVENDKPEQLSE